MKHFKLAGMGALALGAALAAGSACAQPVVSRSICMITGNAAMEAVGDREGHALQASSGTCRIEGGPMDGGVMTQNTIWEIDKANARIVSADGVLRVPGGLAVYRTGGTRTLTMKDGAVTGFAASGEGVYLMGSGKGAPLNGKNFTWTAKPGIAGQYVIETTLAP